MEEINNLEQIAEETNDDFSNDDLFNITSWGADMNLREIITSYKESDIVKPELQRKYVWDKKSASRFIESILLGLPVPSLFFAKTSDSRMLIVDGYQRIKTICDFFDGIWTGDNSPFLKKINVVLKCIQYMLLYLSKGTLKMIAVYIRFLRG